jgi:RNase P/RNase MRP subunit POP5
MRLKHRYIIVKLIDESSYLGVSDPTPFISKDILNIIRESIGSIYGEVGYGQMAMHTVIKYYDPDANTNIFVVRVGREYINQVWLAISCVSSIKRCAVSLQVLKVASCDRTCIAKLLEIMRIHLSSSLPEGAHQDDALKIYKARFEETFPYTQ